MVYQGWWTAGDDPQDSDLLNSNLLQYGTTASRPAAAKAGVIHWSTDDDILTRDNGSTWDTVIDKDAAAGTASLRTLGTGATQAAQGDHNH